MTLWKSAVGKPSKAASSSELGDLVREHGLRRTLSRASVLAYMREHPRPMSHGDVAKALASAGFDRATVYRNLMDLAEVGILVRTDLGDHTWRFELRRDADDGAAHPHFICTDCGVVTCLPRTSVKLVASRRAPKAIKKRAVAVQVRGLCDDCV